MLPVWGRRLKAPPSTPTRGKKKGRGGGGGDGAVRNVVGLAWGRTGGVWSVATTGRGG